MVSFSFNNKNERVVNTKLKELQRKLGSERVETTNFTDTTMVEIACCKGWLDLTDEEHYEKGRFHIYESDDHNNYVDVDLSFIAMINII